MAILLIDNGSKRAAATLRLRALAEQLTTRVGGAVYPVSLQHADRIDPAELQGIPADVFPDFLKRQLEAGVRDFKILPLFFACSRALTSFVPEVAGKLQLEYGGFEISMSDVLYPLPDGDPCLIQILHEHAVWTAEAQGLPLQNLVLVDHGSPEERVTRVRNHLAEQLRARLDDDVLLSEAVMERRPGKKYDFNGPLLSDRLQEMADSRAASAIVIMQFLLPGRHAGPGGDVADICQKAMDDNSGFQVEISPLASEHPLLMEILAGRLTKLTGDNEA